MSKITNPDTEISVSCGFYNSLGDRKYDASTFSSMFDNLITDGIFMSIGNKFIVSANSGNTVNVGSGKCWFNHTWTENTSTLPVECEESEVLLNRYDAIVIEVNSTTSVRDNFIKFVKGTPASNPSKPTMVKTGGVYQYPLCYIYRAAGSTEITGANIENCVGTSAAPFVTGILKTVDIDELLGQWRSDLDLFVASEKADIDAFLTGEETKVNDYIAGKEGEFDQFESNRQAEYDAWYAGMKQLMADVINETDTWSENQKATILDWFADMKGQLSTDAAANLQMQINDDEVKSILMHGFIDGYKTISEDGTIIISVDSTGRKLVKTFTNGFLTSTAVLTDSNGGELGRLVKTISPDGVTIGSTITSI